MKKINTTILKITIFLLFLIAFNQNNYAIPGWQWANTGGGTSEERSYNTAFDTNGNVYSIGSFKNSSIIFDTYTLSGAGLEDIYIVKYDPSGNVLWAKSFGGSGTQLGYSVLCDNNGNVYITGYFDSSTITFDSFTLNNSGNNDVFFVKLNSLGNVLWANSYGGNGDDRGINLTTDINDNVYLIGNFTSPSITFGSTTLFAVGTSKIFVVKFDSNGNSQWAAGSEGQSFDAAVCVKTDINGNVYITGEYYEYSVWFGTDTLSNNGENDIFVAKYDSNGNELWAKSAGGFNTDNVTGLAVENTGEVYFTGHFFSPFITFDTITLNNTDFPAWDMYITKLDQSGNVIWAESATGNADEDVIVGLAKAPSGNLLITGWFNSSITLGTTTLVSNGSFDVFVAELDTSGTFQWAISTGGADQDFTYSISTDGNGDIVIGGFFQSLSLPFGGTTLTDNNPGWDMFVAKLGNPTLVNELSNKNLSVFPNPADDYFTVEFPFPGNYCLRLQNSTGQIVLNAKDITGNNYSINSKELPAGLYYIIIDNNEKIVSKKFILLHD